MLGSIDTYMGEGTIFMGSLLKSDICESMGNEL